jgi:hypothetical protein
MNLAVRIHMNYWELILVGLECQYKQKGAVQFEPPLMDVISKMPLILSLQKKCTNIPEVTGQNNAVF